MNKFNKKGRNNVKEKQKHKQMKRRDKAAARRSPDEDVAPGLSKAKMLKLSVSGQRTGKSKRKAVRRVQKGTVAAVEAGAVSMEDIMMYASQRKKTPSDLAGDEASASLNASKGEKSSSRASIAGFRVKPSKKARLRLKKRGAGAMAIQTGDAAEDMME